MENQSEYRWVDLDDGKQAFLHRSWLTEEPEVSLNWVDVHDQFYMGITLPWPGGAIRVGGFWVSATILDGGVPEKTALNIMISTMQDEGESIDTWLDENG